MKAARSIVSLLLGALLGVGTQACADDTSRGGPGEIQAPAQCVGPEAPSSADRSRPEPGAPRFALTDFQPYSCSAGDTYGLERFRGRVTLVALLAGW